MRTTTTEKKKKKNGMEEDRALLKLSRMMLQVPAASAMAVVAV